VKDATGGERVLGLPKPARLAAATTDHGSVAKSDEGVRFAPDYQQRQQEE
jgi:hypothetical protein